MRKQIVETYSNCDWCKEGLESKLERGYRVVSMVSVPTNQTRYETYCEIIVVYEKEI